MGPTDKLQQLCQSQDGRTKHVLLETASEPDRDGRSMRDVGETYGLTGERVRQIAAVALDEFGADPFILEAATTLWGMVNGGTSAHKIRESGYPLDKSSGLLLMVANRHFRDKPNLSLVATSRWDVQWIATDLDKLAKFAKAAVHPKVTWDTILKELLENSGVKMTMMDASSVIVGLRQEKVLEQTSDGRVVRGGRHVVELIADTLQTAGHPLTIAEIIAELPDSNPRTVRWSVPMVERAIRSSPDRWALKEWGLPTYTSGADVMTRTLGRNGGTMALKDLGMKVAKETGLSPRSVETWAYNLPQFALSDGVVTVSDGSDVSLPQPENSPSMEQTTSGPSKGHWSWKSTVSYAHMGVSSVAIPTAFGTLAGLEMGKRRQPGTINDLEIEATWGTSLFILSSGFRCAVDTAGLNDGDPFVLWWDGTNSTFRLAAR